MKRRIDLVRLVELDSQFREFAKLRVTTTPPCGWVKSVRLALGMNSETLARRVHVSPQGLRQLEQSEADGSISLNTLAKIADGLDCDVRYMLVPRTSLVSQVLSRAEAHVGHSRPPLSKQAGNEGADDERIVELASLLATIDKRSFW